METAQSRCEDCGYVTCKCLLTPAEVASLFRIDSKTLTRWDEAGKFPAGTVIRTLGNHRRYRRTTVERLLDGGQR